jgi:TPR repeat protein
MSNERVWASLAESLGRAGHSGPAAQALAHGAELKREEDAARARLKGLEQALVSAQQAVRAGQEWLRLTGGKQLPSGFIPVNEQRNLGLMGKWPPHPDGTSIAFSNEFLLRWTEEMHRPHPDPEIMNLIQRLQKAGDGDPVAQKEMGETMEKGMWGLRPDLHRAFYWYYRAGLSGNEAAEEHAVRLMRSTDIPPATMEDPALIFPGLWRVAADNFGQGTSVQVFNLAPDGSLAGKLENFGGAAGGAIGNVMAGDPIMAALFGRALQNLTISGQWRYEKQSARLLLNAVVSVPGFPAPPPQISDIGLLGLAKEGNYVVFGRDTKGVSYHLQPVEYKPT